MSTLLGHVVIFTAVAANITVTVSGLRHLRRRHDRLERKLNGHINGQEDSP
jgi:hypothetical protein